MLKLVLGLAVALWAGTAWSADQLEFGPPAAWVKPLDIPEPPKQPDTGAVKMLLFDFEEKLGPGTEEIYSETAVKIQSPQGLSSAGNIALAWKPDSDVAIIHKLHIVRDGRIIDVLAGGRQNFTVLRREANLERAVLDGALTATIQPEDLRVGDILDMAYSIRRNLSAGARPELMMGHLVGPRISHLRLRAVWPASMRARWRETEGLAEPKLAATADGAELVVDMTDTQPVAMPRGAPPRFFQVAGLEISTFPAWSDVSAMFAPLFATAAALKPDSPLKAEAAKIKAASPDPKVEAAAALRLVQDQIRYMLLAMGDGGYVPADADTTWLRRFGDCKGKTAVLLALLHELGIEAEPALVSTRLGDGLDERLPLLEVFDHVMIRATVGGKVYWMDGTRIGDRGLDALPIPRFKWALPVRPAGATLEQLVVPPFDKPRIETSFRLDASAGIDLPAVAHGERIFRGDDATAFRLGLANAPGAERNQDLRAFWAKQYNWLDVRQADAAYDETTGEERVTVDGSARLAWAKASGESERKYRMDRAALGWTPDYHRDPGPHRDAPWAVDYPDFVRTAEIVVLPKGGQGFSVEGGNIDKQVAGFEYKRTVRIDGDIVTMEKTTRALAPEFPAAQTPAAEAAAREMQAATVYVVAPSYYRATREDAERFIDKPAVTADDYIQRAYGIEETKKDHDQAIADLTQAIALDPNSVIAYGNRGYAYLEKRDFDRATADFDKAAQLDPRYGQAFRGLGYVANQQKQYLDALVAFSRAIGADPKDDQALAGRGKAYAALKDDDKAMADFDEVLRLHPEHAYIHDCRGEIFLDRNQPGKALAEADLAVAAKADDGRAHALRAKALRLLGRNDEAAKEETMAGDKEAAKE